MTECCPTCHQTVPHMREGVRLTRTKARIFDCVRSCQGQSRKELAAALSMDDATLKTHIYQMNDLLAAGGLKIVGARGFGYRIYGRRKAAA